MGNAPVLDPDAEARLIDPEMPERASIAAGRRVLVAAQDHLAGGTSFVIETTLAGNTYFRLVEEARRLSFVTRLIYIATEGVAINIARVRLQVLRGRHDVPERDIERRYWRSIKNLVRILPLVDEALLYDNSTDAGHRLFGVAERGKVTLVDTQPRWWTEAF